MIDTIIVFGLIVAIPITYGVAVWLLFKVVNRRLKALEDSTVRSNKLEVEEMGGETIIRSLIFTEGIKIHICQARLPDASGYAPLETGEMVSKGT